MFKMENDKGICHCYMIWFDPLKSKSSTSQRHVGLYVTKDFNKQ